MEQQQPNPKNKVNRGKQGLDAYSRYSTIAIQMVIIIVITSLGGVKLDKLAGTGTNPYGCAVTAGRCVCHVARNQGGLKK